MSGLKPQEIIDIITLDRITEVLQIRNAASPDDARTDAIRDLHHIRNMLVHSADFGHIDAETARATLTQVQRLLAGLSDLENTSLGTTNARRIRSRATAARVADILARHDEAGNPAPQAPTRDGADEYQVPAPTDLARITTLHPRTYNEARTIGEHFREGTPVVVNLTEMADSDARRLVDFSAGLIFGLRGAIDRVTNKVFLLSPGNIEITAEEAGRPDAPAPASRHPAAIHKMAVYLGLVEDDHQDETRGTNEYGAEDEYQVPAPTDLARITTLHPRTYNEARTIGEHFREGTPVVVNLTEMADSDARRLVDFSAGLIFGLRGGIDRVTNKVFLLSPGNIEITAEGKAQLAEPSLFKQS